MKLYGSANTNPGIELKRCFARPWCSRRRVEHRAQPTCSRGRRSSWWS